VADPFLGLSAGDRRDALGVAASLSGRPAHLLEKDVWVVRALATLFGSRLGEQLVFKGGTSLSKAYGVIQRFSEDVDLSCSIRALALGLVGNDAAALPKKPQQRGEARCSGEVRRRLPGWVQGVAQPLVAQGLEDRNWQPRPAWKLFIRYEPTSTGSGYVAPSVTLEFGARSTQRNGRTCAG
jgi:hypothetical protein